LGNGLRIEVQLGDELGLRYALGQPYEPDVQAFLEGFLRPGMVFFDLGASIGHHTLIAAQRVGPGGEVHAFEPLPSEFAKLSANVRLNGFHDRVRLNQLAVSDHAGLVELHTAGDGLGAYASLGRPLWNQGGGVAQVSAITLEQYVRDASCPRIDVLKMDVEGAETAVLRGGHGLFAGHDAPLIICEFSDATAAGLGHSTGTLRDTLEGLGYGLFRFDPLLGRLVPEPRRPGYDYANLVAVKE
jgi:FkbM family methyltransferase